MKRILTAAALAAALLSSAPRAAAACPYKVGPLGRYIAPAIVQGMTATDDGNAVEVWCTTRWTATTGIFWWTAKPICGFLTGSILWSMLTEPRTISATTALLMPCIVTIATGSTIERKELTT